MRAYQLVCLMMTFAPPCFSNTALQPIVPSEGVVSVLTSSDINKRQNQRAFFQENGYIWIKDFFSPEQVALLRSWADAVNTAAQNMLALAQNAHQTTQSPPSTTPGTLIIVPEARDPLQVCRAEDMLSCYPDLHHFITDTLTSYIGRLLGEPYVLFKDKLNFKWPGGGAFPPHQDFPAYEYFGPREHVTAMVCIDPATLENGCLQVAQDWRATYANDPTIDHEKLQQGNAVLPYIEGGSTHGSIQPQYAGKITWIPLETSAGDLVLINSYIPHYSEPNRSGASRRAMFFTYNRLKEGDHRKAYYHAKREDPQHPAFHFATPTKARTK